MKFFNPTPQFAVLIFIILTLFSSCNQDDFLEEDEVLYAPKAQAKTTNTVTLTPIQDAHLTGSTRYNLPIIGVSEGYREAYLMFDLSKIEGEITSASLEFTIKDNPGHGMTQVFTGNNTSWSESKLTTKNRPLAYRNLGKISKSYKVGNTEKINLNAKHLTKGKNTLVVWHRDGQGYTFASKETATPPQLILTYSITSESPSTSKPQTVLPGYYVAVNGKSSNSGRSESTPWSLEHAFKIAKPGDIIYVKAGNYGNRELQMNKKSGGNLPIKIIGYSNTPGDIQSSNGPSFNYGESLNSSKMPLFQVNTSNRLTAFTFLQSNVEIENFQISGYERGVLTHPMTNNVTAKNIILTKMGPQTSNVYRGWGIDIRGQNSLVENCYVENASAVGIQLSNSDNSIIRNSKVYSDNTKNPTDYYFLLASGTNNALVENCYAERAKGLSHGGHGFNVKDNGAYNTFKNCIARRTSFELTFSGVHNNTIDGGAIYGVNTSSSQWASRVSIIGGAHDNTIKNLTINDTHAAIALTTFNNLRGNDASLGYNNKFENITVNNTHTVLLVGGGTNYNSTAKNYTISNSKFSNFQAVARTYYRTQNIIFRNNSFENGDHLFYEAGSKYKPYSKFNVSWQSNSWSNVKFRTP